MHTYSDVRRIGDTKQMQIIIIPCKSLNRLFSHLKRFIKTFGIERIDFVYPASFVDKRKYSIVNGFGADRYCGSTCFRHLRLTDVFRTSAWCVREVELFQFASQACI